MEQDGDQAVVSALITYLDEANDTLRDGFVGAAPLTQKISVPSEWWREHIAAMSLSDQVRDGVTLALDGIAEAGDTVNREMLTRLAAGAESGDTARVASWFSTMCWGAGPRNNFRVRQWRRALEEDYFCDVLSDTARRISEGRLYDAHRGGWMRGTGEAFFTKWLWALGLPGVPGDVRPHVLDARVRNSLDAAGWPDGPNASHRWVEYCTAVGRWADLIQGARPEWTVDGDRVEQILFLRNSGQTDFYSWRNARW